MIKDPLQDYENCSLEKSADWKKWLEFMNTLCNDVQQKKISALIYLNQFLNDFSYQFQDLRSQFGNQALQLVQSVVNNMNIKQFEYQYSFFVNKLLISQNLIKATGSANKVISNYSWQAIQILSEQSQIEFATIEQLINCNKTNKINKIREQCIQSLYIYLNSQSIDFKNSQLKERFLSLYSWALVDNNGEVWKWAKQIKEILELNQKIKPTIANNIINKTQDKTKDSLQNTLKENKKEDIKESPWFEQKNINQIFGTDSLQWDKQQPNSNSLKEWQQKDSQQSNNQNIQNYSIESLPENKSQKFEFNNLNEKQFIDLLDIIDLIFENQEQLQQENQNMLKLFRIKYPIIFYERIKEIYFKDQIVNEWYLSKFINLNFKIIFDLIILDQTSFKFYLLDFLFTINKRVIVDTIKPEMVKQLYKNINLFLNENLQEFELNKIRKTFKHFYQEKIFKDNFELKYFSLSNIKLLQAQQIPFFNSQLNNCNQNEAIKNLTQQIAQNIKIEDIKQQLDHLLNQSQIEKTKFQDLLEKLNFYTKSKDYKQEIFIQQIQTIWSKIQSNIELNKIFFKYQFIQVYYQQLLNNLSNKKNEDNYHYFLKEILNINQIIIENKLNVLLSEILIKYQNKIVEIFNLLINSPLVTIRKYIVYITSSISIIQPQVYLYITNEISEQSKKLVEIYAKRYQEKQNLQQQNLKVIFFYNMISNQNLIQDFQKIIFETQQINSQQDLYNSLVGKIESLELQSLEQVVYFICDQLRFCNYEQKQKVFKIIKYLQFFNEQNLICLGFYIFKHMIESNQINSQQEIELIQQELIALIQFLVKFKSINNCNQQIGNIMDYLISQIQNFNQNILIINTINFILKSTPEDIFAVWLQDLLTKIIEMMYQQQQIKKDLVDLFQSVFCKVGWIWDSDFQKLLEIIDIMFLNEDESQKLNGLQIFFVLKVYWFDDLWKDINKYRDVLNGLKQIQNKEIQDLSEKCLRYLYPTYEISKSINLIESANLSQQSIQNISQIKQKKENLVQLSQVQQTVDKKSIKQEIQQDIIEDLKKEIKQDIILMMQQQQEQINQQNQFILEKMQNIQDQNTHIYDQQLIQNINQNTQNKQQKIETQIIQEKKSKNIIQTINKGIIKQLSKSSQNQISSQVITNQKNKNETQELLQEIQTIKQQLSELKLQSKYQTKYEHANSNIVINSKQNIVQKENKIYQYSQQRISQFEDINEHIASILMDSKNKQRLFILLSQKILFQQFQQINIKIKNKLFEKIIKIILIEINKRRLIYSIDALLWIELYIMEFQKLNQMQIDQLQSVLFNLYPLINSNSKEVYDKVNSYIFTINQYNKLNKPNQVQKTNQIQQQIQIPQQQVQQTNLNSDK